MATLKELVANSSRIVFFGGAGVSTESGIPDFRSRDGLYNQKYSVPPETILSDTYFYSHTEEFYRFYRDKMLPLNAEPNAAHKKLAEWEQEGKLLAVVTQNIDGLHQKAGSKRVYELHGSIYRNHCLSCGKRFSAEYIKESSGIPRCGCGGIIKPDVVLYGEPLDENTILGAVRAIAAADLLIVAGTSLSVYPAASFLSYFRKSRGGLFHALNYHIVTYGCQMNVHESEKIAGILREKGYSTSTESEEKADIIVFNTCCIRENAENHAFGNIGNLKKLKKRKKELIVAVGGCMAQEEGKAQLLKEKFPFIDIIFGTHNVAELGALIDALREKRKKQVSVLPERTETEDRITPVRTSYPNAWVNITYGCNNFCTYCIVPYVRGRERSRRAEVILEEVESLVREGYKEITLLGQNVNSYNSDGQGGMSFPELLDRCARIEGKFRLRFMTSHPKDFTKELALVMQKHDKICNLLHLPVQAGSDRILTLMNRRYTREKYLSEIKMLRELIPNCAVTTDLIVGFPTETEEDFLQTLSLVKEADFSSAFTFVYSPRTGTKAAQMEGRIPEEVSKERIMRLVDAVNENTRLKSLEYVGKVTEILCEDYDEKKGLYLGRNEAGRMGYFASGKNVIGEFVDLKVDHANGISLFGTLD